MPIRCEERNRYATCKKKKGKGDAKIQKRRLNAANIVPKMPPPNKEKCQVFKH
jgi:hypothetical protein